MNKMVKMGLVVLSGLLFGAATVSANHDASAAKVQYEKGTSKVTSAPELTKQGYSFRIQKDAGEFLGRDAKTKHLKVVVSAKTSKKLAEAKTNFKITKVFTYSGVTGNVMYYLVSQNHKYQGWVSAPLVYSKTTKQSQYKALVAIEKRILSRYTKAAESKSGKLTASQKKANATDYKKAVVAAHKLTGSSKTFALDSIKQLKQYGAKQGFTDLPSILWSVYFG